MALSKDDQKIMKAAVEIIERETNTDGASLMVRGFGTFKRKMNAERTARNPQTGDPITVPARSVLKFSASKSTAFEV